MSHKVAKDKVIEKLKKQLGVEIIKCRGETRSQRSLAMALGLPPSNMKYIEDGINAPSGEIYGKIIDELKPPPKNRGKMDELYSRIRKVPPPDICNIINENRELYKLIRFLNGVTLTNEQLKQTEDLFRSFAKDKEKGEI
ncbi:hypothetical protein [Anaerorhabdus sp.]|uniref:hypothetical protein n=1 Tax=Anaerorhabdus sp. TaxID=1872524 RepID=UPI002FC58D5D